MRISGSFDTRQAREQVYARLTDPAWLVAALDYPTPVSASGDECLVRGDVGLGPLRGSMEIHLRITERHDNQEAVYTGWGSGLGSKLKLEASFRLAPRGDVGTHVDWSGEADIDGPVGPIASNLFQPLSRRNFDHLKQSLESDSRDARSS